MLEELLSTAGFWSDIQGANGPVVIKPDLDCFDASSHASTEPALVEYLVDLLHDNGLSEVSVLDARSEDDGWLQNREPGVVAQLVGYRLKTLKGRKYAIVDGRGGEAWRNAALRINFAKNRTHEDCYFALGLHNLAGLARERKALAQDALSVMREAPPHWTLIDAVSSAHGGAGHRAPRAIATHTLFASRSVLAADWAAVARMGLDPYVSPVSKVALEAIGVPQHWIDGDLSPYPLWKNVHPVLARTAQQRVASEEFGRSSAAWFQSVDRELFSFRDFYSDRFNEMVTSLLSQVDENPRALGIVIALNVLLARVGGVLRANRTLFRKDQLYRSDAPLTLDLENVGAGEFDAIRSRLAPYEVLLAHLPAGRGGLRWRHVGGAILFGNEHIVPVKYDTWIRRVDIAKAIQYMNDYVGGSTVVVQRDRRGRPLRQAERNLYLQQPNWLVLLGGEVIDVEKIQAISRSAGRQSIHWRTMVSPNQSAEVDDGCVSFTKTPNGLTRVSVFALQKFTLPHLLRLFDMDLAPALRDSIIESAYTKFFEGTVGNMLAAFEGRDHRIGRAQTKTDPRKAVPRLLATVASAAADFLRERHGGGRGGDNLAWLLGAGATTYPAREGKSTPDIDADGFRHFTSMQPESLDATFQGDALIANLAALARDAPSVLQGLADAVHLDLDALASDRGAK